MDLDLLEPATLGNDNRVLRLWEVPLPNSLSIRQGPSLLGPTEYQLLGDALHFSGNEERINLMLRYQVPLDANSGIVARREYYTRRLYEVSLEKAY